MYHTKDGFATCNTFCRVYHIKTALLNHGKLLYCRKHLKENIHSQTDINRQTIGYTNNCFIILTIVSLTYVPGCISISNKRFRNV